MSGKVLFLVSDVGKGHETGGYSFAKTSGIWCPASAVADRIPEQQWVACADLLGHVFHTAGHRRAPASRLVPSMSSMNPNEMNSTQMAFYGLCGRYKTGILGGVVGIEHHLCLYLRHWAAQGHGSQTADAEPSHTESQAAVGSTGSTACTAEARGLGRSRLGRGCHKGGGSKAGAHSAHGHRQLRHGWHGGEIGKCL